MASLLRLFTALLSLLFVGCVLSTNPGAYVISVYQQQIPGISNQMLNVQVGNTIYKQMIDSGSSLLSFPCNTRRSHNLGCKSNPGLYNLSLANSMDEDTCLANTTGCYNAQQSTCALSTLLTGGNGQNVYLGSFGVDTVSIPSADVLLSTGGSKTLSWCQGIFACTDIYYKCTNAQIPVAGSVCNASSSCPAPTNTMLKNNLPKSQQCPNQQTAAQTTKSGLSIVPGIEAGMLFGENSIPTQLFNLGMIEREVGFCYMPPPRNTMCNATNGNNSYLILGSGPVPKAVSVGGQPQMYTAPLYNYSYPYTSTKPLGTTTTPNFPEFRTHVWDFSMSSYPSGVTTAASCNLSNFSPTSLFSQVLWDTGAFAQQYVPSCVYNAYYEYYTAALAQAQKSYTIVPCDPVGTPQAGSQTTGICGNINYQTMTPPGSSQPIVAPGVCNKIQFTGTPTASQVQQAQEALLDLYPKQLNLTLEGGGNVTMPTAFIVNGCTGNSYTSLNYVAVCSFMQNQTFFWLGNSYFNNHFTTFKLFDDNPSPVLLSPGKHPYYIWGQMSWSDPIDSCAF